MSEKIGANSMDIFLRKILENSIVLILFFIISSCADGIVRYGNPIPATGSYIYGNLLKTDHSGSRKCSISLRSEDTGKVVPLTFQNLGYTLFLVPPGKYSIIGIELSTNIETRLIPIDTDKIQWLSRKISVMAGQAVYIGDYVCVIESSPVITTGNQFRVSFHVLPLGYHMHHTTARIVELYGSEINGYHFVSLQEN